ncbi:MAG: hypothetical protein IJM30_07725 [Thermoguttaceae bacterium]|nr:hypothetical protein [Thermoguttaceae bacterium]
MNLENKELTLETLGRIEAFLEQETPDRADRLISILTACWEIPEEGLAYIVGRLAGSVAGRAVRASRADG